MTIEYGPKGLVGLLTPQANTTVEPEMAILLPRGYAAINARMTSTGPTIEARLIDYFERIESFLPQFANAPITALCFACTGTSYLVGRDAEDATLARVSDRVGVTAMSAATAVVDALNALGAARIGLISPYGGALDEACPPYWRSRGFEVVKVNARQEPDAFHPIYAVPSRAAEHALRDLEGERLDAVVMLGTGMPTLTPIARTPRLGRAPVTSCMHALCWRAVAAMDGVAPDGENFDRWVDRRDWASRLWQGETGA